jgi:LTXXQ motif family protein
MKRRTYLALATVAGLSITAAMAVAQVPPFRREPPSPETIQRMQEGRIAMAVTALKMNEAQLKLWAPVEAQIRSGQAARLKLMQESAERRKAGATAARPELPDRLDRMSAMMAARAERMKALAAAFRPFHAALSEEQKQVIGPLLAQFGAGDRGRRGRWAMHDGGRSGPQ